MLGEYLLPRMRPRRRRWEHFGAVVLEHRAAIRLLFEAGFDHVDSAFESEQRAGEGQGAAPLTGAGLRGQAADAFGLVVVGLSNGRVRFVAAGGADALVLVVDVC